MSKEKTGLKKKAAKISIVIEEVKASSLSKQEVFNKVLTHLRTQGKKSFDNPKTKGESAYFSSDGCKCSIGIFIEKDEYNPVFEHYNVGQMLMLPQVPQSLKERLYSHLENWFLKDLQDVHDVFPVEEWENKMKLIAIRHQLNYFN